MWKLWRKKLLKNQVRGSQVKGQRTVLNLELLEDRTLPALTWSSGIALPVARGGDAAVLGTDNAILVFGGGTTTVNRLAAGATVWGKASSTTLALASPGVASIGGGSLLVYGGSSASDGVQNGALLYDPNNSDNIQDGAGMSTPRTLFAFASDGYGRPYAIGGIDDNGTTLSSVERYDPTTDQWTTLASLPQALSGAAAVYDGAGHILVFGGADSYGNATTNAYSYTIATDTWSTIASLPTATTEAAAVLGADGGVYVLGGKDSNGVAQSTVAMFNGATNTWTAETALPAAVSDEAAVSDSQGSIEVLGGYDASGAAVTTVSVSQPLGSGSSVGAAPVLTPVADTTAVVGVTFRGQLSASGTPAPTFSLLAAPTGMRIEGNTGLIRWTPTLAQVGAQTVTVEASNSAGVDETSFTITVASPVPVITTTTLPAATAGAAYTATITATATTAPGTADPTFSLVSGPQGLSIGATTGVISWTPSTVGTASLVVQAKNFAGSSSQTLSLTINPDTAPPTAPTGLIAGVVAPITTTTLPLSWTASTDNVGVAGYRLYAYTPAVYRGHSGRGGGYTLVSPAKYTLLVDNITATHYTMTGLTAGTTYQYAVAAYDAAGNQSGYSVPYAISTYSLPTLTWYDQGVTANQPVTVVANHSIYLTLFTSGNPTPTLTLGSAPKGVVFTPGQFTNSQLTIVIPNITWTPTSAQVGLHYIKMMEKNAAGTTTTLIPVTVIADVPIPSLTINGGITYTPGNMTPVTGHAFTYQLSLNPAFNNTGTSPQYAQSGTPFQFQISGTSNTNPTTYSLVTGPVGMKLNATTGVGTWTPTKAEAGTTNIKIAAKNAAGTSYLEVTIPTYFTDAPQNVSVGFLTSTSGVNTATLNPVIGWTPPVDVTGIADYKITVVASLTQMATIYDTHSTATSFTLTGLSVEQYSVYVTAYDAKGNPSVTSPVPAALYPGAEPSISWNFSTPDAVAGRAFTAQFTNFNGSVPYAIVSGPANATINSTTGLLSWTPTLSNVGAANFIVSASTGWGTEYLTVDVPVYFTDAPTVTGVTSSVDPVSGGTNWTVAWSPSTLNGASIAGYIVTVVDAAAPAGTPPTVVRVSASTLSLVISNQTTFHGTVEVTAVDAFGNTSEPGSWFTF